MVVPGSVVEKPAFGVELFGIEAIGCAEAGGVGSAGLTYQTFPPRAVVEVLVRHSGSIGHILHMTGMTHPLRPRAHKKHIVLPICPCNCRPPHRFAEV
ncbi:hypothetical protein AT05_11045 [Schleiferia thermophila str. Yellowstone]|nr:hypothetical protein AT05_11045 [Schleiferia thermophila str. Yellowstone]